jgi:hypothetical protein
MILCENFNFFVAKDNNEYVEERILNQKEERRKKKEECQRKLIQKEKEFDSKIENLIADLKEKESRIGSAYFDLNFFKEKVS